MQTDRNKRVEPVSEDEMRPQTPDRSEEDETDDGNELEVNSMQEVPKSKPPVTPVTDVTDEKGRNALKSPPPRRILPFTGNNMNASTTKQTRPDMASDDTDDEL